MCGIAGAVGLQHAPAEPARRAVLDGISHRGPNAEGDRYREGTWLGFRRLSILDLNSRADQPMVDEATGTAIAYNGEIYNFVELRRDLEGHGHRFSTSGDTEVMLRGYLEWGEGVFARCNGMWACAIDDPTAEGVLLSRDRFGEKPLYTGRHPDGSWWFASEIRSLVDIGVGDRRLDLERAFGFLALGDVEDPSGSYFAGITPLPAGTIAVLSATGRSSPQAWFCLDDLMSEAVSRGPGSDEEVRDALDRAVELRLRSDVEVGTSLSGGVDSSAVVASLRAVDAERTLHAFTASFPGRDIDEWGRAKQVGERFGVALHRVEPTPEGFVDELDAMVDHQGAPIESPTVYAQWCVMRRANEEGVTVLLDGQGADETWGGYLKYAGFALADGVGRGRLPSSAGMVRAWQSLGGLPRVDVPQLAGLATGERTRTRLVGVLADRRRRPLGPAFADVAVRDVQAPGRGPLMERAARSDLRRVVLPRLLRYADRNSMAWSREIRLPFLDPEVVRLGIGSNWFDGFASGWSKLALRRAVDSRLPKEITWRREKTAYEVPVNEWLRRPDLSALVDQAGNDLADLGLLASPSTAALDPWRVLSLARLVDRYGLTP
jgi:asparagine synthase (glutamine-hydrolysing)